MSKNRLQESASSDALRLKALQSGFESRVEVNQRMLIDKMLARYSSDFVVCRELIQNSDDAQATSFHFEITCDNGSSEKDFHNKTITEIRTINNGLVFNETDWKRVAAIAEGNTNVESVGQFGVGFFSVFSFSEEPIITSGSDYMAFIWRDDNSLTTYRHKLPDEQQTKLTSVILKMRTKYILHTETNIDFDVTVNSSEETNGKSRNKKQKKSITTTTTNDIIPTINLAQLKAYFTKGKKTGDLRILHLNFIL
jgi:HSP90 family molecular chaperone